MGSEPSPEKAPEGGVRHEVPDDVTVLDPGEYHLDFLLGADVEITLPSPDAVIKARYGPRFVTDEIKALMEGTSGFLSIKGGVMQGPDGTKVLAPLSLSERERACGCASE